MKATGSPPPSRASVATSSRLGSAVQTTASGAASGGVIGPPFQTNGVVALSVSRASRTARERRNEGTTAKRARQAGGSGRPVSSTGGIPTTSAGRPRSHAPGLAGPAAPTDPAHTPPLAGAPTPPAGRAPARPSRLLPSHDPRLSKGDLSEGDGSAWRSERQRPVGWVASPYLFGLSSRP